MGDLGDMEHLKAHRKHEKKNEYVFDKHANLKNKAKNAFKRRRLNIEDEDDNWEEEIREYVK